MFSMKEHRLINSWELTGSREQAEELTQDTFELP